MTTKKKIVSEVDQVLDRLVLVADELKHLSEQVISKEELKPLQEKQAELISLLEQLDADYKEELYSSTKKIKDRLQKKLRKFQKLNKEFIQNVASMRGVIQFEEGG